MQLQWQPLLAPECKLLDLGLVPLFSQMIMKIEILWMYLRVKMMKKLLLLLVVRGSSLQRCGMTSPRCGMEVNEGQVHPL
jgi:hypothetical protein